MINRIIQKVSLPPSLEAEVVIKLESIENQKKL